MQLSPILPLNYVGSQNKCSFHLVHPSLNFVPQCVVQDPCTPLVIALFTVVGMSLANVVRFFNKLQSHQGFVAVALLSLNWFMLGTLAHPALPYVGQMGSGAVYVLGGRFLRFLGFENIMRAAKVASHESFELY